MPKPIAVVQSGQVTPGHMTSWTTDGVAQDAGISVTNLNAALHSAMPAALTRASISTTLSALLPDTLMVSGYNTAGDLGAGAVYTRVGASSGGVLAIQTTDLVWYNLVLGLPFNVGWFGAKGDGITDDVAALQAALDASAGQVLEFPGRTFNVNTTLQLNSSNIHIRGVPGLTKITTSTLFNTFGLGNINNAVIEDIYFETTYFNAAEDLLGCVFSFNTTYSNITFNRCNFNAPNAYTNAIKFDMDVSSLNVIEFIDCNVVNAGRMGFEVQNHVTPLVPNYFRIRWIGGSVNNTGLHGPLGMGISLSGSGQNCEIDTTFNNNFFACIEVVGTSYSRFSGRIYNQTRQSDALSFTNVYPMTGNVIERVKCVGPLSNGGAVIRNQTNLIMRENLIDGYGFVGRDLVGTRSFGDTYISNLGTAFFLEGTSVNNEWVETTCDNSACPTNFSTVRFSGGATQGNVFIRPFILKGTGGSNMDQASGAKNNSVRDDRLTANSVYSGDDLYFNLVLTADLDFSLVPNLPKVMEFQGSTASVFVITFPANFSVDVWMVNNSTQNISVIAVGAAGELLLPGTAKRALFDNVNIQLV